MATLYELCEEIQALFDLAEDEDVSMDVLSDTFEGLSMEFEDKIEGYTVAMKSILADVEGLKAEKKRLEARISTMSNNADRIKGTIEDAMIKAGKKKFKTKLFSFGIQKNPPSLGDVNEELLDEAYWVPHPATIDRVKLLADVKANPDAFAGIVSLKQTESIRIR